MRIDYLPNHPDIKIYQDDKCIKINTDTQLLGEFIEVYREDEVLDIGTNTGALLLYASLFHPKKLIGIDINENALALAKENMALNNITNATLLNQDAMTYQEKLVDVIICNPPYFKTKNDNKSSNEYLNMAKHEDGFTLIGLLKTAKRNLKPGGTFYMLFTTQRLVEVISLLKENHLEPKIMQFVYDENRNESNLFMVKCSYCGKTGVKVLKPKIIQRKAHV